MHKAIAIAVIFLAAACGDNIRPDDYGFDLDPPVITDHPVSGEDCADFDVNVTCPDAGLEDDANEQDAGPELTEEQRGACCHALLDGAPPKHECGYPPGLCKNGKKTMFCKTADGADAQFELCNP